MEAREQFRAPLVAWQAYAGTAARQGALTIVGTYPWALLGAGGTRVSAITATPTREKSVRTVYDFHSLLLLLLFYSHPLLSPPFLLSVHTSCEDTKRST
jgi:hypothetical protein